MLPCTPTTGLVLKQQANETTAYYIPVKFSYRPETLYIEWQCIELMLHSFGAVKLVITVITTGEKRSFAFPRNALKRWQVMSQQRLLIFSMGEKSSVRDGEYWNIEQLYVICYMFTICDICRILFNVQINLASTIYSHTLHMRSTSFNGTQNAR